MSRIEQLSISGIRNFAPDIPEIIAFDPPVTLILGKNGSGKTVRTFQTDKPAEFTFSIQFFLDYYRISQICNNRRNASWN